MRKIRTLLLVSASVLALSASQAKAGPAIGFLQGIVAGLAGSAVIGGTVATAGFLGGVAASTYLGGSFLLRLALTVGINSIMASHNRPQMPQPQDQMVNMSQPIQSMQRGYGRVRKGGAVGFTGFAGNARHYAVIIAAHRTKGPVAHWLDTLEVTLGGGGTVTTAPISGYGNIRTYRGLPGQAADPTLVANFGEVTSEYDFAQLSYGAITAYKPPGSAFTEVYPGGREWAYAPVWDMWDEIYDPRTDTYGWTDNAALIIAHEALFHGKTVDWANVAEEADVCDELVTNGDGGTQKRWTLNVFFDDTVTWEMARDTLGRACDAFFYETVDGRIGFLVGRYIEPDITLTDRDFYAISIQEKAWGPDVPGEAVVEYVEPLHDYQQSPSGAVVVAAGQPRLKDQLWAVDSHNQAFRVATRQIAKARARYAMQGTIKLIGYELIRKRFVTIALNDPSMTVTFEIDSLVRNGDGVSFAIQGTSVLPEDFAPDALASEPARPARGQVESIDEVPAGAGLAGVAVTGTGGVAQIEWSWPPQAASLTQVLRGRVVGSADWQEVFAGEGQTTLLATGLIDGASYEAQIRNRTASGRVGAWSSVVTVMAVANTAAPGPLSGFAATVSGGTTGALTFTAPNDPNYAAARIWRGTSATFGAAALVRTEYGAPGLADGWDDAGLTTGTYYYWAAPINGSGIAGALSGPQSITII